ncbi:MAG: alpha/beta hydrolase, partial [Terriglobia bacterium]
GRSQGSPTEKGVYLDAQAAYDYLTRQRGVPPERIVILGQSLGTAVAVDLATKRSVAGLILEAGFPSARRVAQVTMWLPGVGYLMRSKFESARKLKQIRVPVLVAHCRQDPVIPYPLGEELFAAANQPKQFVFYPGACHEPLYIADPADYAARLRTFLQTTGE